MTDRSIVRAFCHVHVQRMVDFLGVCDWRVDWELHRLQGNDIGSIQILPDYHRATITFDMDHLEDDQDMLDVIFHEVAHILVSKFDVARDIIIQGEVMEGGQRRAWTHAGEQTLCRLEWLWRNHLRSLYLDGFTRSDDGCNT